MTEPPNNDAAPLAGGARQNEPNATNAMRPDEIQQFLSLLTAPGDVFEIRAPNCAERRGSKYTSTAAGYFQHERLEDAVAAIAKLDRSGCAPVIYVTLNPVDPALLGRAVNRLKGKAKETTSDGNVVSRRWLLIDCDPIRPSGVSATDAELEMARTKAEAVKTYLRSLGWPEPVVVMSGNGYHLLYRIDLPADDGGLVKRVLESLDARFSDAQVGIDTTVHNAARITKVAGTLAAGKGDNLVGVAGVEDRPHRRARLQNPPAEAGPVARSLLEAIAGPAPPEPTASVGRAGTQSGFELAGWLGRHLPDARGPKAWQGTGEIWTLPVCPFNPEHANGSAFVGRRSGGAIVAGCHHNSCQHWGWAELRATFEPQGSAAPIGIVSASPEREAERNEWDPVPLTDLAPSAPPAWVWQGYAARGHSTLFTGLWKAGKSTLLGWLLRDIQRGGGLVGSALGIKTLVISEESNRIWSNRRDDLELDGSVHVIIRPFKTRPSFPEWEEFIVYIARLIGCEGYGLVIFDTLPALWPVTEENDASQVGTALMPLHAVTDLDASLILANHPRKGDASEAQASRGSGALTGWVDVIVEMRRFAPEDAHDRRRVLRAYGRFDDIPPEAVFELGDDGYKVIGDRATVTKQERDEVIKGILAEADAPLTVKEVHTGYAGQPKPGLGTVRHALNAGAERGAWTRFGTGKKRDAHRYCRLGFVAFNLTPLEATNDSERVEPPEGATGEPELVGAARRLFTPPGGRTVVRVHRKGGPTP